MVPDTIVQAGVTFHFLAPDTAGTPLTRSRAFRALLRDLRPDVFHVHGLGFAREVRELHELAPDTPILLQDHADRVPRFWRRGPWRSGAAAASGVSFCARAQAEPFRRARLLPPDVEIFEIPELTSSFTPGDAAAARAATGLHGDPALLWVGHLDANKDPLTVLEGVSAAARTCRTCSSGAALRCRHCWQPSKRESRATQCSALACTCWAACRTRESSSSCARPTCSCSAVTAKAAARRSSKRWQRALTPIVTDIPSSRALTGNGAVGELWPCGDWRALSTALRRGAAAAGVAARARVRAHFDVELSSSALGRKLAAAYVRLVDRPAPASASRVTS